MHILVTGGAGFIGTNLCKTLLDQGHHVYCVDNFITSSGKNISYLESAKNFQFIQHDIVNDLPQSFTSLPAIDQIYHLACPTGVPNLVPLAEEMLLTCSIGTRNILELARTHRASFLCTSSSESYGDPLVAPQAETYTGNVDPVGIRSPYEEGKRFSESLAVMYARKYGVDAKLVRIFNTYGPWMSLDDTRVIPRFMTQAIAGKPIPIHGNGEQVRTFCYVDDVVAGLLLVMEKGKAAEVYNVGSDTQITIAELAKKIISLTKSKSTIEFIERPRHDHQSRMPQLDKINQLGWKSTIHLDEGLYLTKRWVNTFT